MKEKELLTLQLRIIPEMVEILDKRYSILKKIYYNQPVGRRALSQELNIGERIVRTEVNFLKDQGLVEINSIGMMVTKDGEDIIEKLEVMIHEINGLANLEKQLMTKLNLKKVIVVPGSIDEDITVLREMGRIAAQYIRNIIEDDTIIALTGGSSVSQIVENFPKIQKPKVMVVPARGGIGREVETQASTLAAKLAHKISSNYKVLHVPDNLSSEALETMMNEPEIKDTMDKLSSANLLLFGIGRADEMSLRRGMSKEERDYLLEKGAVAEAFGYYFNKTGDIVFKTPTIGVNFIDVKKIKNIIAIAGGKNKARALIATKTQNPSMVLITDEGAAREIIKILEEK